MTELLASPGLDFSCINSLGALSCVREEWKALVEETGSDPFFHPDWFEAWWTHFAVDCELACIILREKGRLVGILPFVLRTVWFGPLRVKLARLSGTDPYTLLLKLPIRENLVSHAIRESISFLLENKLCHAVSLTPVSELSDLKDTLVTTGLPGDIAVHRASNGSHVVFDLPKSFDEFLSRLSKNRRSQFRRSYRALSEKFGMHVRVTHPDREQFAEFIALHDSQWKSVGRGGHFTDWPESRNFYCDLAGHSGTDGLVQIHELVGLTGVMVKHFSLVLGQNCHARLPARVMDPELEKLSIGKVGLLLMLESMINDGVTRIEAGMGEYDHKISLGGQNVGTEKVIAFADTPVGRIRMKALLGWAGCLNLVYYRIWFLKLAPRFRKLTGGKPRPLWRGWIRTRL